MERQLEPDSNDSQNPRLVVNAFALPAEENAKLNDAKSAEESYTVATGIWNLIVNRDGEGLRQLLDNYRISIEELEQTSNEFKQVAPLPWNSRVEGFPRLFTAKSSMVGSNMYFHVKTSEKQAVPKGTTPLHYCVHRRDATCCQLLLAKCADLTLWDGNGKTAFTIARESNDKNIMACFKRDHINRQILLQEKSMLLADIKNRCSRETQLGQELSELRAELANSSKRMMAYQSQNAQMANKIQALTSRIDNNERVSKRSNEGEEKSWARERDRLLDELDDARLKQQNLTILLAETEEDKTKSQHELRRAQDEKKQWLSEDGEQSGVNLSRVTHLFL
jgi:hypothetical protein